MPTDFSKNITERKHMHTKLGIVHKAAYDLVLAPYYSPVSNIGDIWRLEEGSDEGSIVLDIDEVGFDAFLQQFV